MSFRDKAREVQAAGAASRGNFTPHGVPKRIYSFWLENSGSMKALRITNGRERENFCHFWRVVAIWAPLLWAWKKIQPAVDSPFAPVVALAVLLIGFFVAAAITDSVMVLLIVIGGVLALALTGVGIGTLVGMWEKKYPQQFKTFWKYTGMTLLVGTVLAVCSMIVYGMGLAGVVLLVTFAATLAALWVGVPRISDWIQGRRAMREAAREAEVEAYYDEHGHYPEQEPREPGRISKFFSGVADFVVLIAQVVRVNKWKICPMVDISK